MEYLGERVMLEKPVTFIDQTGDNVIVETLDHETYEVRAGEALAAVSTAETALGVISCAGS